MFFAKVCFPCCRDPRDPQLRETYCAQNILSHAFSLLELLS